MSSFQIDPTQFTDIEEHPYYKQLKKKMKNQSKKATENPIKQHPSKDHADSKNTHRQSEFNSDSLIDIEDQVRLSATSWEEDYLSDANDKDKADFDLNNRVKKEESIQKNNRHLIQFLGYKINLKHRIPELKELFRYNMIQSRSHNYFIAKFSQFKIGVVGQILSWLGVPIVTLKKMKRTALKEAFDENIENMGENIYHTELALLVYGNNKKSKSSLKIYRTTQTQLIKQMENLNRYGYWSESKILEMRYKQLAKIREEFVKEKLDLEYEYSYQLQAGVYYDQQ